MKKLLSVVICTALLCMCMAITASADAPKLPWVDEDVKIEIIMDFDSNADAPMDANTSGLWSGGSWPVTSEWRDGQMVFTEVMLDQFWFIYNTEQLLSKHAAGSIKNADGIGVYIKNGTDFDFSYGPYLSCWVDKDGDGVNETMLNYKLHREDALVYLYYSQDGTVSRTFPLPDGDNWAVTIPAGFEGYVVMPLNSFTVYEQQGEEFVPRDFIPGTESIDMWGMIFNGQSMYVDKNSEVIVDDIFVYGTNVADEPGKTSFEVGNVDLENEIQPGTTPAPETTETPETTEGNSAPATPSPQATNTSAATQSADVEPSASEQTSPEDSDSMLWLYIVIGVIAAGAIAAVIIVIVKKKKQDKSNG